MLFLLRFYFSLIIIRASLSQEENYNEEGWQAAADFLLESIDTAVNPCKDFYKFACGRWQKTYNETTDPKSEGEKAQNDVMQNAYRALEEIPSNDTTIPEYQQKLKRFYVQCTDAIVPEDHLSDVYNYTKIVIGPMALIESGEIDRKDPYFLLGYVQRMLDIKLLIEASIESHEVGCTMIPHLVLMPKQVQADDYQIRSKVKSLTKVILNISSALGISINDAEVAQRLSELLWFEKNISDTIKWVHEPEIYHLSELSQLNPSVNWQAFFAGLLPDHVLTTWNWSDPKIVFYVTAYFQQLHTWIEKMGYEKLLDYAYINVIDTYSTNYFENAGDPLEECTQYCMSHASAPTSRVFFESLGGSDPDPKLIWKLRQDVELLGQSILAAARYMIHTAEWLDSEDKAAIVEKVNSIRFNPGIPDWIMNDTVVTQLTPTYDPELSRFTNHLKLAQQKYRLTMERLIKDGVDLSEESNFQDNAYYGRNEISFWLGQITPPLYNIHYPMVLKFGIVGWAFGHELFHGFDYEGTTTKRGDVIRRWLKESTLQQFIKRSQCILKEYSGFCYDEEDYCITGGTSINDNIADFEGIKVTYMAFKFLMKAMGGERPLPGLEQYTSDQLYFISVARYWCSTGKDDVIKYRYMDNTHAPARARVELPMMNFPAFAHAFNCKVGSKFAPLHTCSLWSDFLEPSLEQNKRKKR